MVTLLVEQWWSQRLSLKLSFICFVFDYTHLLASSEINAMYWSSFLLKFSSPPPSALFIVVALKNLLLVHII